MRSKTARPQDRKGYKQDRKGCHLTLFVGGILGIHIHWDAQDTPNGYKKSYP